MESAIIALPLEPLFPLEDVTNPIGKNVCLFALRKCARNNALAVLILH